MAYKNKLIRNTQIGQDIIFLQTAKDTNGNLLEMEAFYHTFSKEPPPHYHPYQREDFRVLQGELSVRINGRCTILKAGDSLQIPPNTTHSMWNGSHSKTVVNWQVRPAMNTEHFLETATGIISNRTSNNACRPSLLQMALIVNSYSRVFRLSKPTFLLQKIVFGILTPLAYLRGYRPNYKEYID